MANEAESQQSGTSPAQSAQDAAKAKEGQQPAAGQFARESTPERVAHAQAREVPETADLSGEDAIARQDERHAAVREAQHEDAVRQAQETAKNRERARQEFDESERGDVRDQIQNAERIMRLPTPEALDELGAVVGDPTKGPSA